MNWVYVNLHNLHNSFYLNILYLNIMYSNVSILEGNFILAAIKSAVKNKNGITKHCNERKKEQLSSAKGNTRVSCQTLVEIH